MSIPNDAQRIILDQMPGYSIIMQWTSGALMVLPEGRYTGARVINLDGQVMSLTQYLTLRSQGSQRRSTQELTPSPAGS